MYKITRIAQWTLALSILVGCSNIKEADLISGQITTIAQPSTGAKLCLNKHIDSSTDFSAAIIADSLAFVSLKETGASICVTRMSDGCCLGKFCPLGRSLSEPLSIFPEIDFVSCNGETLGLLLSYVDSRVFVWNVTKSLASNQTIYDKILVLDNPDKGIFPFMAGYFLDNNQFVVYNTRQNARFHSVPQEYEVYEWNNGQQLRSFTPFQTVDFRDGTYSSDTFFKSSHTINPSRTKIANAMLYAPIINIMDVNTGQSRSFRLSKCKTFTAENRYYHFLSICSDEKYIYAIYSGCEPDSFENTHSELLIFDWEGHIIMKYDLGMPLSKIQSDNGELYFTSYLSTDMYSASKTDLVDKTD